MSEGFFVKEIKLKNFRNYENFLLDNLNDLNILVGKNAIGKTNIIEAIQLLTQGISFRNLHTSELVNTNQSTQQAKISAKIFDAKTSSTHEIDMKILEGKKKFSINGKNTNLSALKGKFPSIVFTPDDLELIKSTNTVRRNAFDNLGSQISKDYYTVYKDYMRAIKQKNKLLKDGIWKSDG